MIQINDQKKQLLEKIDAIKSSIDTFRPLSPHILSLLKEHYRIGLTYTSNALEGNSLTETETKIVLEEGLTVAGKPMKDYYEALGHSEAYDLLFNLTKNKTITENDICTLHKLFYYRIDAHNAGVYRNVQAFISGTDVILPPPSQLKQLMATFVAEIPTLEKEYHPVEYAALVHLQFVHIHPFIDGNGRTARLLMNCALMQKGYVITLIPPVCRREYLDSLKMSNKGVNDPFILFIAQRVYESHKEYLRLLENLTKE